MFTYKTFNNIAEEGLSVMASRNIHDASENPDGLMLRSHKLVAAEFGKNLSVSYTHLTLPTNREV